MRLLPCLAVLMACNLTLTPPDGVDSSGVDSGEEPADSWVGSHRYKVGASATQVSCDMTWTVLGEPLPTTAGCPSCEFVFELELTYDTESTNDSTCDARASDEQATWGYDPDHAEGPSIGAVDPVAGFTRLGTAELDADGAFSYTFENMYDPYGGYYPFMSQWGSATLTPPED